MRRGEEMSDGGKGSTQRPTDKQKFDEAYDRIFGKKRSTQDSRQHKRRKIRTDEFDKPSFASYGGID